MGKTRTNRRKKAGHGKWKRIAIYVILGLVGSALASALPLYAIFSGPEEKVVEPLQPIPERMEPLEPNWTCGPRQGAVVAVDLSDTMSLPHKEAAVEAGAEVVGGEAEWRHTYAASARFFGGGGRSDTAVTPLELNCLVPPAKPEFIEPPPPSCAPEKYSISKVADDSMSGGYTKCAERHNEYAKKMEEHNRQVLFYNLNVAASSIENEHRFKEFVAQFRARLQSVANTLLADKIYRQKTHLIEAFSSIHSACQEFRRKRQLQDGEECVAMMYSDFDPDPMPRDLEERLKGIDLAGITVHAFVIQHNTTQTAVDKKKREVIRWLEIMKAIPDVNDFAYDPAGYSF